MSKKDKQRKQSYILTRETLGMTFILFSAVVAVMLLTHKAIFGVLGAAICTFMYGTFGYGSYFVTACIALFGVWLTFNKFPKLKLKVVGVIAAVAIAAFLLFHAVTTRNFAMNGYGEYLADCYNNASLGYAGYTFGGIVSGLIVYPIAKGTTYIGAYVIFSLILVGCGYLAFMVVRKRIMEKRLADASSSREEDEDEELGDAKRNEKVDNLYSINDEHEIIKNRKVAEEKTKPQAAEAEGKETAEREEQANRGRKILFEPGEFAAESYRKNLIFNENSYFNHPVRNDEDYMHSFSSGKPVNKTDNKVTQTPPEQSTYTSSYSNDVENSTEDSATPAYLYGDKPVENLIDEIPDELDERITGRYDNYTVERGHTDFENQEEEQDETENDFTLPESEVNEEPIIRGRDASDVVPPRREESGRSESRNSDSGLFDIFSASNPRLQSESTVEPDASLLDNSRRRGSREELFDDEGDDNLFGDSSPLSEGRERVNNSPRSNEIINDSKDDNGVVHPARGMGFGSFDTSEKSETEFDPPSRRNITPPVKEEAPAPQPAQEKPKHVWKKYARPTLDLLDDYPENSNVNTGEIEENKQIICDTLASFRIASQVSNVVVGPAITRYDVIIEDKTNIKNALKYREAIAMALMKDNVNAYLNYSKGAISIEVPNSKRTTVGLKSLLTSNQFINCKPNSLTFAFGKNVEGQVVCPDITKMPHLLVAGTTGSGKSICLSALIISLLYKYGPEELRFILVDPKQVEFISYDKLPHLMINEIIYDVDKAIKALNWAIKEMENRYALFKDMTEKGIATKNLTEYNAHLPAGEEKLPKIVIILDEFGDLMLQAKKDIESRIIRLVQKARACGIHLILATQRPSVDCITGLIKSNLPTRIGFKVNSFDDARCIFDIGGAEKLLGMGDSYFRSAENPELARVQGCFVDTHEVQKVTDFIKEHNETYFDQSVSDFINTVEEPADTGTDDGGANSAETKIDDTFIKALKFCVTSNQASVSMIQRRFPIGYMKACKIIDWMENMNYITQSEGSKPRKVLLSREEFIKIFGEVDD